ncbi:hypothetical protein GCM10017562_66270 [Streptomyces roseofulvus]|uniref:hypothetical protein n=1 Tax=Streptomyces roseofulvus TaxID=33902 RepID=UPI0031FD5C2F
MWEAIERYAAKYGTTQDGCLLRGPGGCFTEGMERRRVRQLFADLPPEARVGDHGPAESVCALYSDRVVGVDVLDLPL